MRDVALIAAGFVLGLLFMETVSAFPNRRAAQHYFNRMVIYQRALMKARQATDDFHLYQELDRALHAAAEPKNESLIR